MIIQVNNVKSLNIPQTTFLNIFKKAMIKDLIQNPLIVANNLISKEQICTSLNIENLDSKLFQKLTAHTRCNFKSNIKVTGYTKNK